MAITIIITVNAGINISKISSANIRIDIENIMKKAISITNIKEILFFGLLVNLVRTCLKDSFLS